MADNQFNPLHLNPHQQDYHVARKDHLGQVLPKPEISLRDLFDTKPHTTNPQPGVKPHEKDAD